MTNLSEEAGFSVYHDGTVLQLNWLTQPTQQARTPVVRICAVEPELLLLVTADDCLFTARLNATRRTLQLYLQRTDVLDMGFCRLTRQLFVVTTAGIVLMQHLGSATYSEHSWQPLSFDPLELSEEGILIKRVCCSEQGVLFITRNGEVYVMGSCGDVFTAEMQPTHLRLFDESKELLDLAAGDEFFVLLLRRFYDDKHDFLDLMGKTMVNRTGTSAQCHFPLPNRQSTPEVDTYSGGEDADKKQELNSNSSLHSFSSKSSQSHGEHDFETHLQQMLKQGYMLLHTQVVSFGAVNSGLLGTADHIKRSTINNVQKLDASGVSSVATGREHTVARTLDGRLYHWGLNTKQQLNGRTPATDLSTPTEFQLDKMGWDAQERSILEACCGDFHTVLLNARGEVLEKERRLNAYDKDFVALHMRDTCRQSSPLLLACDAFTVHNHRIFQRQHHSCFNNLQNHLRMMLKHQHAIQMLQMSQHKSLSPALKQLQQVCLSFNRILYLLAALLKSFEGYYRNDYDNPADILFIRYYRECIELFEEYTKAFCDIRSVNGFAEGGKVFSQLSNVPLLPDKRDETDLTPLFVQPFEIYPHLLELIKELSKSRREFTEHLACWDGFARQKSEAFELADKTKTFWQENERNMKILHFQRKHRRVVLTSHIVPLKLAATTLSVSTTNFILFSDCLCQVGSQLYTYPLVTMWVKMEHDNALLIITPEKSFRVMTHTREQRNFWYTKLEESIMAALGRQEGGKMTSVRMTTYVFGKNHPTYANVHAYGRWRNGVLHGSCYLEYPDGKFYYGEVRHGEIEGYGKMVIPSVGLYEGSFKAGKFHGYGIYEMKDNEIYEGNFRDGFFHGHGMLRGNNHTYVGEYQANAKCGYGILDDMITGDKYMGMFADNKRTGAGTCITMNGDYFEGLFANDVLAGMGIAAFENDYYYEGELTMHGPCGKGTYYMPSGSVEGEDSGITGDDEFFNRQFIGNILSGQLGGTWQDVRVISGSVAINRRFPKYPKSIGELVVDNNRKWRSLFDNFEEQVIGSVLTSSADNSMSPIRHLWNRIAIFMTTQREREKSQEQQQDMAYQSTHSYFAKNISWGYTNGFDKLSLKSTNSLLTGAKSSILDLSGTSFTSQRRSHSQETLYNTDLNDTDFMSAYNLSYYHHNGEYANSLLSTQFGTNWANDSMSSMRSSYDSISNLSGSLNNNTITSASGLEFVPSFGMTTLTEHDVAAIKEYLVQAFRDHHHPLCILNQRIANCFYTSYGCWKVKPTAILAKQAMREWESISKRVYKFVRKMFPALPEEFCIIESAREVVSHITLLYPLILSEGIYSTLFVLYANKYSRKDEMYRQNLLYAEKLKDVELAEYLGLESSLLLVVNNVLFGDAVQTLKQLQEKYSPKAMLTVIENAMQQITDAHKMVESETSVILAADSMMPLTLFLVLRAAVPHLGAELALLDDLTGGANFQFEMNGIAGYCYTTLKASYEHISAKPFNKT